MSRPRGPTRRNPAGTSRLGDDDRGASVVVNYVLTLIIVTLLISGLFLAANDFIRTEQKRVANSEFEVLGNRLAADLSAIDRMVQTTEGQTNADIELRTVLPANVAGSQYDIELSRTAVSGGHQIEIVLSAVGVDSTVTVRVKTDWPVEETTVAGGDVTFTYESGDSVVSVS